MNILVLTRNNWNDSNNVGNTLTNILLNVSKRSDTKIYNIACSGYQPETEVCDDFLCTSEKKVLKARFSRINAWKMAQKTTGSDNAYFESSTKKFFRAHQFMTARFAREFCWQIGKWKCEQLDSYLEKARPDIVIMPVYGTWYMHRLFRYVCKKTGAKGMLFFWDDYVSFKQLSFNPLFWLYRVILRSEIKKSVRYADLKYVISPKMQEEYETYFKEKMPILTKGYDFGTAPEYVCDENKTLVLTYMGNIGNGRWKQLQALGQAIKKINEENNRKEYELHVYTLSTRTPEIIKALNIEQACTLEDFLPKSEVNRVLQSSDILVHVEPCEKRDYLRYRLSFSTKIVDYFMAGRCILSIGKESGTVDYLKQNQCAIVVSDPLEIYPKLQEILNDKQILQKNAFAAWECGRNHHSNEMMNKIIETDMNSIL